jgi:hypothetical protein
MPFSIRVDFSEGKLAKGFESSKASFTARAKGEESILRTSWSTVCGVRPSASN